MGVGLQRYSKKSDFWCSDTWGGTDVKFSLPQDESTYKLPESTRVLLPETSMEPRKRSRFISKATVRAASFLYSRSLGRASLFQSPLPLLCLGNRKLDTDTPSRQEAYLPILKNGRSKSDPTEHRCEHDGCCVWEGHQAGREVPMKGRGTRQVTV